MAASSSASRGRGPAMRSSRAASSESGLGIDAETLRSLGMSSSEINSLLGGSSSSSSSSGIGSSTVPPESSSPIIGSMDADNFDENYDDYDEYEYDADLDALEEEEEEEELEDEEEGDEDIFMLPDDDISEVDEVDTFEEEELLNDDEELEEEPEEDEEEFLVDTAEVEEDFGEEEEDADVIGNQFQENEYDEEEVNDEYDTEIEEDDAILDEDDEVNDEETFPPLSNDAEMVDVDDLDDLDEDDFADELPPEEEILEMEERLIQDQDGSIPVADDIDVDEYEEYDLEDPLEEAEVDLGLNSAPTLVEEEVELPTSTKEDQATTTEDGDFDEYNTKDSSGKDEVNGVEVDVAPIKEEEEAEGLRDKEEKIIKDPVNPEKILKDEQQDKERGEKTQATKVITDSKPKPEPEAKPESTLGLDQEPKSGPEETEPKPKPETESKLEPKTGTKLEPLPELERETKPETEKETKPEPTSKSNVELNLELEPMVVIKEPKPEITNEPELESKPTTTSSDPDTTKSTFSDIKSVTEEATKAGKIAVGSALPILLPKIGRSLMGSPVAVQIFAIASVGNIALQHMGALKRKRKDHLPGSTSPQRTHSTVVEATSATTTTADEAFDAATELDYEESDYIEDVEGYGFGRPRPQRRSYRQYEEEDAGDEDVIEYMEETKQKKKGLGGFGWGPRRRKQAGKNESDITIVDTSVPSTIPEAPPAPKKRGLAFNLMGKNTLEYEFDKALKELDVLKIRAKKAEDTRDQLEIDVDSAMQQLREARKNLSEVTKTNNYLKNQLADNKRILERAINVERQKTNTELTRLREQMVEVLERERRMMKAQLAKSSTEIRAMIDDSWDNEYEYVEKEYDEE